MSVSVLIPTYNNEGQLRACLDSLARNGAGIGEVLVVNNGEALPSLAAIEPGENLGWQGGVNLAAERAGGDYLLLLNDDTEATGEADWLLKLLEVLERDPQAGAVGPASNRVRGLQRITREAPAVLLQLPCLSGFCLLVRRADFEAVGGLDAALPGGDDLEFCWRLHLAGKTCVARRDSFVFHHGGTTGRKFYGPANQVGGWDSPQARAAAQAAIDLKHGAGTWQWLHRTPARPYTLP